ncbi:hypothetical protein F5X96DRAFT_632906 [Biscogniauxia mediterranea]|nr:hypothetical protein F5X96DRAFT_632906 [Biscogniauxia mediterranea]
MYSTSLFILCVIFVFFFFSLYLIHPLFCFPCVRPYLHPPSLLPYLTPIPGHATRVTALVLKLRVVFLSQLSPRESKSALYVCMVRTTSCGGLG